MRSVPYDEHGGDEHFANDITPFHNPEQMYAESAYAESVIVLASAVSGRSQKPSVGVRAEQASNTIEHYTTALQPYPHPGPCMFYFLKTYEN
jgi:hypothetical protein